jgi:hypothetical protein
VVVALVMGGGGGAGYNMGMWDMREGAMDGAMGRDGDVRDRNIGNMG